MFTVEFGLFPLVAIVVGALLTLVFFSVVRLKCSARWAMGFIFAAMLTVTVCSLVSPVRWVEFDTPVEVVVEPEETMLSPVKVVEAENGVASPMLKLKAKAPVTNHRQVRPLFHDASQLFGWLWLAGVVLMLSSMVWQCSRLFLMKRRQERMGDVDGIGLYATGGTDAYSFGRSVFIPRMFDDEMRRFMLLHELQHVRHGHFFWLCSLQVLLAFNWYNPFCWLLFREMRLQQELQVDGDVIRQGIDRTAYQYSLLRASLQSGSPVWILSAFGRKPITQRVAFMNRELNMRSNVRRSILSSVLALGVLSLAVFVSCQTNEKEKEHPLMGWWKMDFTKNADSDTELYPFGKQIAFYNYDTFLTITYRARNGMSLAFTFSAEETRLQGDTLVDALGDPMRYEFVDDDTFQNLWHRQPYQNAMPKGPEIIDQWSRIPVDDELLELFGCLRKADHTDGGKFDGVWLSLTNTVSPTDPDKDDGRREYLLVSDSLFLSLNYHRQEPKAFRAAGSGYSGVLKEFGEYLQFGDMAPVVYSMPDAGHLVVRDATNEHATQHVFQRIDMPTDLKRMFMAPFTHEHFQLQ